MKKSVLVLPVALAFAVTMVASTPAVADPVEPPTPDQVGIMVMVDGVLVPLSEEFQESVSLDLQPPRPQPRPRPKDENGSANLINFDQWVSCFAANAEESVFATYTWWWDGTSRDVRLKCGNEFWGYKHIRTEHESDWQNKLDAARNAGWNVGPIANGGSWDDLMSAGAASAIDWPTGVYDNPANTTTCVYSTMYFWNYTTDTLAYQFDVRAGFANNNDRLITTFPMTVGSC